jgi:hypothetical protein
MIQYRVIQTIDGTFGCEWQITHTLEVDKPISRKEIAMRLNIDIDSITDIRVV